MKRVLTTSVIVLLIMLPIRVFANDGCVGRFVNPITDVCWRCMFPITIGSTPVFHGDVPDTPNPHQPLCVCQDGVVPRVGITLGFWEPSRLVDVTRHPFCFVNLGGVTLQASGTVRAGAVRSRTASGRNVSFYQVHWYVYPLLTWLNLITDATCVEKGNFDVAYITELDPSWNDDELAFILNPEAILFANPIAQTACAADCVAASAHLPLDTLFWCAGCQGSMYPLTGHVQDDEGGPQASALLVERMTFKLHRQGLLWGTYGGKALCHQYPMPIMDKSMYRSQIMYPIPITTTPKGCEPYGRTTTLWGAREHFPVKGEDFGYLIFRKRNCCAF